MTDNGNSLVKMREILKEAEAKVLAEPIQAEAPVLTQQERMERCQQIITDALNQYQCTLESTFTYEQLGPALQFRPGSVSLRAIEDKKP